MKHYTQETFKVPLSFGKGVTWAVLYAPLLLAQGVELGSLVLLPYLAIAPGSKPGGPSPRAVSQPLGILLCFLKITLDLTYLKSILISYTVSRYPDP